MKTITSLTCLLVEDDNRLRSSMIDWLTRRFPMKVLEARGGNGALEILADNQVDLVVSDIEMADGNGVDLGIAMAKLIPRPTLIYFSSHPFLIEQSRKYAMAGVLKPDFATLVKVVEIEIARLIDG